MINNLLEFSRIQSGRLEVHKQHILLDSVIHPLITQANGVYQKEIIYDIPKDLYTYADPKICSMIFSNIFSNALKYSKSKVKIAAFKVSDTLYFTIEDDGAGISDLDKQKVFDFFTQTGNEDVLKMESKGTGIGLYTVKLLADICDRTIELSTSKELGGAKFTIIGGLND